MLFLFFFFLPSICLSLGYFFTKDFLINYGNIESVFFIDNTMNFSSLEGTYENPFLNISSALSKLNQLTPQNIILIAPGNILDDLETNFIINCSLTIASSRIMFDERPTLVIKNQGSFLILKTLEIKDLIIIFDDSLNIEEFFSLKVNASLILKVFLIINSVLILLNFKS